MTGKARWLVAGIAAILLGAVVSFFLFFGGSFDSAVRYVDRRLAPVLSEPVTEEPAQGQAEDSPDIVKTADAPSVRPDDMLRIAGRVVAADGTPLGRVRISAYPQEKFYDSADGRFALTGISRGDTVFLRAEVDGYGPVPESPEEGRVELAEADATDVEIILGPALSISGTVVDSAGNPVMWVKVLTRRLGDAGGDWPSATSGQDGSIAIDPLSPGEYEFVFPKSGGDLNASARPQRIRVPKGESLTDVQIIFPEGEETRRTISGLVTDRGGVPIADAQISTNEREELCRTDKQGRYGAALTPRMTEVFAQHRDFSDSQHTTIASETTVANFVLPPLSAVEGRVVDARTGRPVPEFRVRARAGGRPRKGGYTLVKDPDGRFALDKVKAGKVTVSVIARGYADGSTTPGIVAPGETRRNVEVRLGVGCGVEGHVVDSAGRPVRLARVRAEGPPGTAQPSPRTSDVSDDDGYFFLAAVPAGAVRFIADHNDFVQSTTHVNIVPGTNTGVRLVLDAGARVRGRISRGGRPIEYGQAHADLPGLSRSLYSAVGADGAFEIRGVPDGIADIRIVAGRRDNAVSLTRRIQVEHGEAPELTFDLAAATARVQGRVYAAPGKVSTMLTEIRAYALDDTGELITTQGEMWSVGGFQLLLAPGEARLAVDNSKGGLRYVRVTAKEDETVKQDILLYGGATLYCDVQFPTDTPRYVHLLDGAVDIPEITPHFIDTLPARLAATASINADGQGSIPALAPGIYTVFALVSGRDPGSGAEVYRQWDSKIVEIATEDEVVALDLRQQKR